MYTLCGLTAESQNIIPLTPLLLLLRFMVPLKPLVISVYVILHSYYHHVSPSLCLCGLN